MPGGISMSANRRGLRGCMVTNRRIGRIGLIRRIGKGRGRRFCIATNREYLTRWATRRSGAARRSDGEPEVRSTFGNHTPRLGGARVPACPAHEREREAERRFCAENAVFRAQKTEVRRSAPPCIHKNGVVDETRTRDLLGHNQAL